MALETSLVTVGTTPTVLYVATGPNSVNLTIEPTTNKLEVGGPDVTVVNGIDIEGNALFYVSLDAGESIYGICAAGTVDVRIMAQGV